MMTPSPPLASTKTSRVIKASASTIYQAFIDPVALATWMAPDGMTGMVHEFDGRVGGGYQMSLFYPVSEQVNPGKSDEREDRYTARYVELIPSTRIVAAINFDTTDPAFTGEMIMDVSLQGNDYETEVTIIFKNLPPGIQPEDNDAGTQSSLEKLARYVE